MSLFTPDEIEEVILGMAELVIENRKMRKYIDELELDQACRNAHNRYLFTHKEEDKARYEKLRDIQDNNDSVRLMDVAGWRSSREEINWREAMRTDE